VTAAGSREPLLAVEGLDVHYGGIQAVRSVTLQVRPGEAVAVIGPNGAGKTTLLRSLAGLKAPTAGRVTLGGEDVTGLPAERLVGHGLALVPEGRGVFADLSVLDNLRLGAYRRRADRALRDDLEAVLGLFPILRERARQAAGSLSGGEQQMLAIGRGLMTKPRLLLLDEPSLGLAPLAVREVFDRLIGLREEGATILLVEQNTRAALRLADRGYVMQQGRVVGAGTRDELLEDPAVKAAYLGRGEPQATRGARSVEAR
jgi:branched-chain amino acid transport system ATP-binding protein